MSLEDISEYGVRRAIEEFDQLGRTQFLEKYGYGRSQSYFLEDDGKRYDSKAIAGVALKYSLGASPLKHEDFSGGAATVQRKLESLGFKVVHEAVNPDWSDNELRSIVEDYLSMLKSELAGVPYNKTEHREELAGKLQNRSKGSIEFKHANVSSALFELGFPYIDGYKPREHSQAAIADVVDEYLQKDSALMALIEGKLDLIEAPDSLTEVEPPVPSSSKEKEPKKRRAVRIDFQKQEERNRKLGNAGEKLVLEFERTRLKEAGRPDLAEKVEHVSETQGDGLGYDIVSFSIEDKENEMFIEVKTSNGPIETPFFISRNEVDFSDEYSEQFVLYRIFDFRKEAQFYKRLGSLKKHFDLVPTTFMASPLGK